MYFGVFNLGPSELIIILIIVIVLFGGKKLPTLGRSLGEMIHNFKTSSREDLSQDAAEKSPKENV